MGIEVSTCCDEPRALYLTNESWNTVSRTNYVYTVLTEQNRKERRKDSQSRLVAIGKCLLVITCKGHGFWPLLCPQVAKEKTNRSCFFKSAVWMLILGSLAPGVKRFGKWKFLPSSFHFPSFCSLNYLLFPFQAFPPGTTFLLGITVFVYCVPASSGALLSRAASVDPSRCGPRTVPYTFQTWEFHFGHTMGLFPPASKILLFSFLDC